MEVKVIKPNGFCHGVVTAIRKTVEASKEHEDIYVLGMIIHNEIVVNELKKLGVKTIDDKSKTRLQLLDEIESGTVIFTAHGVSNEVYQKAKNKGLKIIDATCKDVKKTHDIISDHIANGYDVVYIGKNKHPETEGCIGIDSQKVHLITSFGDIDKLKIDNDKIIITNQTTLSFLDIKVIIDKVQKKYPHSKFINEICNATQLRQEAVIDTKDVDLIIVVGDSRSNNTRKLVEIGSNKAKIKTIRISSIDDLNIGILNGVYKVAVTAGASTPHVIIQEVVDYLTRFNINDCMTWEKPKRTENIMDMYY